MESRSSRRGKDNQKPLNHRIGYLLSLGVSGKLIVDTTVQIYNPFLTIIAAGLGISVVSMGRLVALRGFMGLAAPFLGGLADRIGYRRVVRVNLLLIGVGMLLAAVSGNVILFAVAMILAGIGHVGYTPNWHAYLSARLPYEKRATGLGITEYSWALAGILGLSASGYLIEAFTWRAPFYLFGAALVAMAFVYGTLPVDHISGASSQDRPAMRQMVRPTPRFTAFFTLGKHAISVWSSIATCGFITFANMHLMIIHGGWLATEFSLGAVNLGKVAFIFGFVDLVASFLVSVFADRVGKKRSAAIGIVGMVIGFTILPFLDRSLALALVGIGVPRFFFEIAIVSMFPLLSEQVESQRGKVLSLGITANLLATMLAGLTGPAAYLRYGVWGLGPVCVASSVVAFVLLIRLVRERPSAPQVDRV